MRLNQFRILSISKVTVLMLVMTSFSLLLNKPAQANNFYVGKDPYTKYNGIKCSDSAYRANYADILDSKGNLIGQIENFYSKFCNTNWDRVWWNRTAYVYVEIKSDAPPWASGYQEQCFPDFGPCIAPEPRKAPYHFYSGNLSPAWTDMIDGTKVTVATGELYDLRDKTVYGGQAKA